MAEEKVLSTPMELPLEDGTGEDLIKDLEKQKEEINKEAEKELKDRAEIIDDINSAQEKALNIKNMTEKLVLDEASDDVLNEGYEDLLVGEPGNSFAADVYNALSEVALKYQGDFGDMSPEEYKEIFEQAFDWFLLHFFEENLEEDLPKDLAKAYRSNPFKIGSGKDPYGYEKIAAVAGNKPIADLKYYSNSVGTDIDFKNSNYTEITPEEALKLKRAGEADKLRIIFDGQLVAFTPEGKPKYKASRNWNSNRALYNKNGKTVEHTTLLPFKEILNRASKIYVADEKKIDRDLKNKRSNNPESRFFDAEGVSNLSRNARWEISQLNSLKNSIKDAKDRYNLAVNEYNTIVADDTRPEEVIKKYADNVEYLKQNLNIKIKAYNNALNTINNFRADKRNYSSKQDLQTTISKFKELRQNYSDVNRKLVSSQKDLDSVKASGSPEVVRRRRDLDAANAELKNLRIRIAKLETYLETADEDNEQVVKQYADIVDQYQAQLDSIQANLDNIKNKKREDLEEPVGEEQLKEAKIITPFENYKPWSGAVDTYNAIENAGKLEELDALIEELYPEGIDETQLNDILWFESDWLFNELGIGEQEDE